MRIILVGPSGVGKTTIGRVVAKRLGFEFYDMDFLLHDKFNFPKRNSYDFSEINEKKKIEIDILESVLSRDDFVLSTCGGLIEEQFDSNIRKVFEVLKLERNVVLIVPFEDIFLTKKLLMKRFEVSVITEDVSLKFERDYKIFYRLAKMIVYTKENSVDDVVKNVLEIVK